MSKLSRLAATLLVAVLALAGCGGSSHHAPHLVKPLQTATVHQTPLTAAQVIAEKCPRGHSAMGCSSTASPSAKPFFGSVSGALFPDVYEGQGAVNWGAVKAWQQSHGWPVAAIFKMGEFRLDNEAQRNAQQTAALGFWRSGYWFVRDYGSNGCSREADAITNTAHALGIVIVSLDLEVREASGYGACLTPILRVRGFVVVEYTSPGSNPGGVDTSAPLWEATFGSSFSPIWHPVVAWQCSDGVFGCVTDVPGIGRDDVNVDLGITSLGAPPPDPFAVFPKTVFRFGKDHASEYKTAKTWHDAGCRTPVVRERCKTTYFHLKLLLGRIYFVAFNRLVHGRWVPIRSARWGFPSKQQPLGSRAALIRADLRQR